MGLDVVTGGLGFVGSHVVDRLVNLRRDVAVIDSLDSGQRDNVTSKEILYIQGDVRDSSWWQALADRKIDRIFHFAANASVPRSSDDPMYDLTTNIGGTLMLLDFAVQHGAHFVFISSAAVYGTPQYVPTDESHPLKPISHYGVSKLSGEYYVDLYRREKGLKTSIIRYFNIFGPRQPRYIVFDYLRKAKLDSDVFEVLGTGKQVRTQLYVTDAVEATLLVAEEGDHNPYNIGSDRTFTVLELAEMVLEVAKATHKEIVVTGTSWPGDIQILRPDLTRIKHLGFTEKLTVMQGLQRML